MRTESFESANKRIAKNTIFIYIRLFVTMLIGLYTSRVVLQVLGISDFGLFGVVGGVLGMFTFLTSSLGAATSRFLNVEMGKPDGEVNRVFNVNITLHIAFALIIFVLAETFGLYYVYNYLKVAPGKFDDALFVYQVSVITCCIGIISGPYGSLMTSHERFKFQTNFDIINTFIRLGLVIALQFYPGNSLRFYAIIMGLTTANSFVVYYYITHHDYPETIKLRFVRGWENYRPVLSFGFWKILGTLAMMARASGSDLIMNHFFGTAVNGAYAVSRSVNNYVSIFSANFDISASPQIVQSYSANNMARCNYLVNKLGRFSLLLFEIVFFPLYIELEFVLTLWLGEVPPGVLTFCRINMLLAGVSLSCGGFLHIINAAGRLKWFQINLCFFFLICLPIGYWLFSIGYPPYSILVLFLLADVAQRCIQLVLLKKILHFDSWRYVREAYVPPFIIAIMMSLYMLGYFQLHIESVVFRLLGIVLTGVVTMALIYAIGLTNGEKKKAINQLRKRMNGIMAKGIIVF